jgi:signal peptidase II
MGEILLAAAVVLLDQLSKTFSTQLAAARGSTVVIPGVLGLTCIHNTGASWGILSGRTTLLLAVTALVCAVIFAALLLHRPKWGLPRIALAMVLGGAVGNALDRLADGYVTDMLETLFMDFPIFNVADCFITVGGILFCAALLLEERRDRRLKREGKAELPDAEHTDPGT